MFGSKRVRLEVVEEGVVKEEFNLSLAGGLMRIQEFSNKISSKFKGHVEVEMCKDQTRCILYNFKDEDDELVTTYRLVEIFDEIFVVDRDYLYELIHEIALDHPELKTQLEDEKIKEKIFTQVRFDMAARFDSESLDKTISDIFIKSAIKNLVKTP